MKRYIIETDNQRIWSYEVEGTDTAFSCKLLKPHGDKAYWLEDSQDYWDWFLGEISHVEGTEINICVLYLDTAQEKFQQFYELMPQFSYPVKADWKASELILFFQNFRSTTLEVTFAERPSRFIQKNGTAIIVNDRGNIHVVNDAASASEIDVDSVTEDATAKTTKSLISLKKSRVKVYSPKEQTGKIVNPVPKVSSTLAIKKEKSPTNHVAEDFSSENITAEDLQRHIERQTEGQCDTVFFRSTVFSTQE